MLKSITEEKRRETNKEVFFMEKITKRDKFAPLHLSFVLVLTYSTLWVGTRSTSTSFEISPLES